MVLNLQSQGWQSEYSTKTGKSKQVGTGRLDQISVIQYGSTRSLTLAKVGFYLMNQ